MYGDGYEYSLKYTSWQVTKSVLFEGITIVVVKCQTHFIFEITTFATYRSLPHVNETVDIKYHTCNKDNKSNILSFLKHHPYQEYLHNVQ